MQLADAIQKYIVLAQTLNLRISSNDTIESALDILADFIEREIRKETAVTSTKMASRTICDNDADKIPF